MDFGIALIAMKNGRKVHRKAWVDYQCLYIDKVADEKVILLDKGKTKECWTPKHKDLIIEDWEIVKND